LIPASRNFSNRDISRYYSETTSDYSTLWFDRVNLAMHFGYQADASMTHAQGLENSNRVLADLADIHPGSRVLDAGCGLGGTSLWLAAKRSAQIVGIGIGEDQIRFANEEANRRSLAGAAKFLVADFNAMPFKEHSFDVVWAQESLCHAKDKARFFKEAARVLTPDGCIIVADGMLKRTNVTDAERHLLLQWFDGWKLSSLWTATELADAAREAEFSVISVEDVTANTVLSHRRLYLRACGMFPLAMLMRIVGLRNSVQTGNAFAALRQYQALKRGCWFYGILVARKSKIAPVLSDQVARRNVG